MNRVVKIIYIALTVTSWGILLYSLIRLLIVYPSLADEIGVHFDGDGGFDVIDHKSYIAYPYIISIISLVLGELFTFLTLKIKMGFKVSEIGERKLRSAFVLLINLMKVCLTFFFAGVWVDCVIRQSPLNVLIPQVILMTIFLAWMIFLIYAIIVKIRDSKAKSV